MRYTPVERTGFQGYCVRGRGQWNIYDKVIGGIVIVIIVTRVIIIDYIIEASFDELIIGQLYDAGLDDMCLIDTK